MIASELKADEAVLASLGYKQEFKRDFRAIEIFGLSFSVIGLVPSIASVLVYAVPYGGPFAMVWGWAITSVFLVFVALAIAELGSSMPTSGGVYYWTYHLSSPRYRTVLAWLVGYVNTLSYIAGIAGVDWSCAVEIMAAVSIGSNQTFSATTAQTYGLFIAIVVLHCTLVSMSTKFLARLQSFGVFLNIALVLIFIIGIPIATPVEFKNPASYAFGHFETFFDWPNGFALILSFLAPLWTVSGFDATVHVSEEARNAKTAVPWGILCSIITGCVLGWIVNVVLALNMGTDLAGILSSPIEQPMATILLNSFGKSGTLVIWSFLILGQSGKVIISSRQNFAFSRDGAFPFSTNLYRLNKSMTSPVYSVWVAGFMGALLGLLVFAGRTASTALFSLAVIGQYTSISIPIAARFFGGQNFKPGPFTLGRLSLPVAAVAIAWMIFMLIVLLFPASSTVSGAGDMNYSVVVYGGIVSLALAYFYFPKYGGAHWFRGPVTTVMIDSGNYGKEHELGISTPTGSAGVPGEIESLQEDQLLI
ncbi:APC amino acid permease [Vararia minispora EC-137]|uniref:APC amino acid permease n=1 Tax=Vararia minispora EC-137 TaxID=1314806 RepID=A0ACB8QQS4_9AGAM|nr:APC amino acid permease [Vararia minispora EC-137]